MQKILSLIASLAILVMVSGCTNSAEADSKEQKAVQQQQMVYLAKQPAPYFDWSLSRQLFTDFYKAANQAVSTWSYITPQNSAQVLFETPSQGYPIPFNTQLTNPLQVAWEDSHGSGVIAQAEPNGLFTSPSSDGTIINATNDDGTVSPIYTEMKVTTFPFPVKWKGDHWERVAGVEPSIKLSLKKRG